MQVQNTSITSDILGRYYTNSYVGTILVSSMGAISPEFVLDLGSGDGALTTAAAKIWQDARYYTVDIDENARSASLRVSQKSLIEQQVLMSEIRQCDAMLLRTPAH